LTDDETSRAKSRAVSPYRKIIPAEEIVEYCSLLKARGLPFFIVGAARNAVIENVLAVDGAVAVELNRSVCADCREYSRCSRAFLVLESLRRCSKHLDRWHARERRSKKDEPDK
jgi:hypothetical protein